MSKLADAVIVGTAIVKNIHNSGGDPQVLQTFVEELVSGLQ